MLRVDRIECEATYHQHTAREHNRSDTNPCHRSDQMYFDTVEDVRSGYGAINKSLHHRITYPLNSQSSLSQKK